MSLLLSPLTLRGTQFRNRIWVSPMCQYSSTDGFPSDWHLVHLGSFARGGAGLVLTEATAVSPEGRISPADAGIWSDDQAQAYLRIVDFVRGQGSVPGIQLAHAGRKGSTQSPWLGRGYVEPADGGWHTVGPSATGFADWPAPAELDEAGLAGVVDDFVAAARRSLDAGFEVAELHGAHGYLLHEFLSPLSNTRTDGYGGSFENRVRLLLEITEAVREVWPDDKALLVRLSASDWVDGGWDLEQTVETARLLRDRGVDLVDVSSGGLDPRQAITTGPGYQVPFAETVRREAGVPVGAVGEITEPVQAEKILGDGQADVVLLARALLREPHWPLRALAELGGAATEGTDGAAMWPDQYARARL